MPETVRALEAQKAVTDAVPILREFQLLVSSLLPILIISNLF